MPPNTKPITYTLRDLATLLGAQLQGSDTLVITGVNTLADAQANQISFLDNPKYQAQLPQTKAGAVILAPSNLLAACPTNALVVDQPYVAYAKVAQLFWRKPEAPVGIHPTALIDETATIDSTASIGPYCVIGKRVVINAGSIVGAHTIIADDCTVGSDSTLAARVTLYHEVHIGQRCMIHSGAVIGSDGFGFAPTKTQYEKIPQLGGVTIGDDVEIGANTTIDRGALGNTIIEEGVKLDNQIQIGHNVKVGAHTVIAGCTGVSGSTTIGKRCMIGGAVGIAGHLTIADHVMLTGMAMVTHSLTTPGVYASGTGLMPRADWQKAVVRFRQLNQIAKTVQNISGRRGAACRAQPGQLDSEESKF